ncbi:SRPBCC family protein [Aurantibacillus circumpalustris]|uniref:SRPBCC family protein n=1 Tax=Aurantibacillus circumpalustris TaxID=3036359 RepID=UPI00295AA75F|nr:SRPBCC family protein [Aurantibacillus circumpalustris]
MKNTKTPTVITVETTVNVPIEKAWKYWTEPKHIMNWNNASPDWHTPKSENDLKVGGKFSSTMAAKDGSMSFDFGGIYTSIVPNEKIEYTLGDDRKVKIHFSQTEKGVKIVESFDAESENPVDMQQGGWQAILDNFKKYSEAN